jgi:hypothetical protein
MFLALRTALSRSDASSDPFGLIFYSIIIIVIKNAATDFPA